MKAYESILDVWNDALGAIGARPVAAADERTPEAEVCARYFERARRETLRAYPWGFAAVRVRLARKDVPEGYEQIFKYAYAYPRRCARVLSVTDGKPRFRRGLFCLRGAEGERLILTNAEAAFADIVEDVKDPGLWDDGFRRALALKLACLICVPLLHGSARLGDLRALYEAAIREAKAEDASEEPPAPVYDSWLAARLGVCREDC